MTVNVSHYTADWLFGVRRARVRGAALGGQMPGRDPVPLAKRTKVYLLQ